MRIKLKSTASRGNGTAVLAAVLIVLIIMTAVYFVSANFRPEDSETEDTFVYETFPRDTESDTATDGVDTADTDEEGDSEEFGESETSDKDSVIGDTSELPDSAETEGCEHNWREPTCISPRYCSACGTVDGGELGHEWTEATCTEPETCTRCGEINGDPLGHDLSTATCNEASKCGRCGEVKGEALGHKWKDATCTKPERCSRCGETKGEPLDHEWKDATCTKPETCSRCGDTKGEALGHSWKDATCTKAKRCSRCSKTSGSPLGHKYVDGSCTVCKATDPNYNDDGTGSAAEGTKPLYVNGKKTGVSVIAVDGKYYVSVSGFAKAVDPDTSFKISDNGSTCTVSAKGIDIKASKGKIYIEANERALPTSKLSADGGKVTAPVDIMAKIFSVSITYADDRVNATESEGYIKSGDDVYDDDELYDLSHLINSEAGEEPFDGLLAVGAVVMNRVSNSRFPSTVYAVIYQKNQFTVVDSDVFEREPNEQSVIAAKMCLEGYRYDKRVLFFDSVGKGTWASENGIFLYKIGNHYFYDLP